MKNSLTTWDQKLGNARTFFDRFYRQCSDLVNLYRSYMSDPYYVPRIYNSKLFSPRKHKAYNILWSNTQILLPSVYQQMPVAQVARRFHDKDPVGRAASEMLERTLNYHIKESNFDHSVRMAIKTRFIVGQGNIWLRYDPKITQDRNGNEQQKDCIYVDFVNYWDFLCSPCDEWERVTWVARRAYMSPSAFEQRFGIDATGFISSSSVQRDNGIYPSYEKPYSGENVCGVWEIWDKETRNVFFCL